LQQVEVGPDAQFLQGARDSGGAQVQGPLLHVLPGRQDLIGGQFPGDHAAVAGLLPEPAHGRFPLGGLFPLADRFGVQLDDQFAGGRPGLPERHPRHQPGQDLVGLAGVLVGQDAGLLGEDLQLERVDPPGPQRREQQRQPGLYYGRVVHLPGRGLRSRAQLIAQLDGGELIGRPRPGMAGRVLRGRGQQRPRRPGLQPPGRGDDPQQLIIRAPAQPLGVFAGDRVDHGGQQRARGHRVGLAVLREPGQGQLLRRRAHVPALRQPLTVLGRAFFLLLGQGRREAIGLLAVARRAEGKVMGHANSITGLQV
jgi:hypothetical protein